MPRIQKILERVYRSERLRRRAAISRTQNVEAGTDTDEAGNVVSNWRKCTTTIVSAEFDGVIEIYLDPDEIRALAEKVFNSARGRVRRGPIELRLVGKTEVAGAIRSPRRRFRNSFQ